MKTWDYLEQLRAKHGGCSDYRLAKLLDVKTPSMVRYRAGKEMDDEVCIRCADRLGVSPAKVLADVNAARAAQLGKPEVVAVWEQIARMVGTPAARPARVTATRRRAAALRAKPAGAVSRKKRMVAGDGIEPPTRGFSKSTSPLHASGRNKHRRRRSRPIIRPSYRPLPERPPVLAT
ncbi:MAG TPA: hypothetical protein VEC14_01175 [Reyranellaceae bacterium]|nr:hypothetical protein [Reyranellaceae bacterium]